MLHKLPHFGGKKDKELASSDAFLLMAGTGLTHKWPGSQVGVSVLLHDT